ncbi:hypothetical protein BDC45DRAFT_568590 [Circinella umbellata]|nr:hypothetical protein BDC45DRAFT_568590 [Circinella umbellata]
MLYISPLSATATARSGKYRDVILTGTCESRHDLSAEEWENRKLKLHATKQKQQQQDDEKQLKQIMNLNQQKQRQQQQRQHRH